MSPQNPRVKVAASLAQRKYRERHGLVAVEGARFIRQAIAFGADFRFFLVGESYSEPDVLEEVAALGVPVLCVSDDTMRKVADSTTPQGILGVAGAAREADGLIDTSSWLVVVDRVRDPGNLGAIVRTATAVGVDGLLVTAGSADVRHPRAIRASAGGYFAIPHKSGLDPEGLATRLSGCGWRLVTADAKAPRDIYTFDWSGRVALVVGSESEGPHRSLVGEGVQIPMPGGVESLNVSVAAGILMYEAWRQRTKGGIMIGNVNESVRSSQVRAQGNDVEE